MFFLFDMDGTLTIRESIPIIAELSDKKDVVNNLTISALTGNDDYEANLLRRIGILGTIPVEKVSEAVGKMALRPGIAKFIMEHKNNCAVVTSNLDCWVNRLLEPLGCRIFSSHAEVLNGMISNVCNIIKKEEVVAYYRQMGEQTVFVGDGFNDREAMIHADISIAFLASPYSDRTLGEICNYTCEDEQSLLRIIYDICEKQ